MSSTRETRNEGSRDVHLACGSRGVGGHTRPPVALPVVSARPQKTGTQVTLPHCFRPQPPWSNWARTTIIGGEIETPSWVTGAHACSILRPFISTWETSSGNQSAP
jgi:hypothetical protein